MYKSLDGSAELNSVANDFNSVLGSEFLPAVGSQVMVLKKGLISTDSINDTHLIALACQTTNEEVILPMSCDKKFSEIKQSDGSIGHKVMCMEDCSQNGTT